MPCIFMYYGVAHKKQLRMSMFFTPCLGIGAITMMGIHLMEKAPFSPMHFFLEQVKEEMLTLMMMKCG